MFYPEIAFYLIVINLLHGVFLAVMGIWSIVRRSGEADQKFNGLTHIVKAIALILISLFLYYQLQSGLDAVYIVYAMIVATLLPAYKEIWDLLKQIFRGIFSTRSQIWYQHNNAQIEQKEAGEIEYKSSVTGKPVDYIERK